MKQLIIILSILSLILFGAWSCSERTEQSQKEAVGAAETVKEKSADTVETVQAGTGTATEAAVEKAKKVIEELQVTPQGSTEESKGSE